MPARIFLRDIAGCTAGQIEDLDWSSFVQSARQHHGVTADLDAYTMPIEDAARRFVESLHGPRLVRDDRGREDREARRDAKAGVVR
jgi:hypothetical protein